MERLNDILTNIDLKIIYEETPLLEKPLKLKITNRFIQVYDYSNNFFVSILKSCDKITVIKVWYHPLYELRLGFLNDKQMIILNRDDIGECNI